VTSQALATSGKLDDASLPGGSGITDLWGLAVGKKAAADLVAGKVKAIAKTTDLNLSGRSVVVLVEGRAVGEVELGKQLKARVWAVESAKAFARPKPTNIPAAAEGVVKGVRLVERLKATAIDEPVTKSRAKTYDPRPVIDSVLLRDVRTLAGWGEEAALQKALAEVERRGLEVERHQKLELSLDLEPETLTTAELFETHRALHITKQWSHETTAGIHAQVVAELADRGMPHPEPPPGLDQRSRPLEPSQVEIRKSVTEEALADLVAAVEQYPVLIQKRVEGRPVVVAKTADQVKVMGEDGTDHTAEVPEVVKAVAALKAESIELEGVLEPWHGGEVLQVQDLVYDGRDLRDWPVEKRIERLAELGIEQATSATPSLRVPVNELPVIEAADGETLERAIRTVKALPGSAGAVVKPAASVDPGDWLELEIEPVAKVAPSEPVPFVRRGSELLIGIQGGRRVERWELQGEELAKRGAPLPWGALRAEATERGQAELGAKKPWQQEYFLRDQSSASRVIVRKLEIGEIQKAAHSYTQCMSCKNAPVIDVLWADGRGRAWFCKGCYPKWLHKGGGAKNLEVIGTKVILGGRAPAKYSDRHNRVTTSKTAEPHELSGSWLVVRPEDKTPTVLQAESVTKRWIPPLGVSALPQAVAEQVPAELAYWKAGTLTAARNLRDLLVAKIDTNEVEIDYSKAYTPAEVSESDANPTTEQAELFVSIAKIDTDRQIVTGIVLEPGEVDAQNDTVSAEVIEKASIDFLSRFNSETQLGFMHRVFGEIGLKLAASWVAMSNQTLGGKKVKRGSWLMSVKVVDPKLWARIKKGEFAGFSIGGVAKVR
jgi:hypothetical protein